MTVETRQPSLVDTILRLQELADYIVPFGIRAVSELHLADHLTNGPRTITDLATATNTHAPSLYRVLRALACKGIFTETQPHTFALTPLADLLRTDHPLSLADAYPFVIGDLRAWAEFGHTLRTGESAFEHVHGTGYYDYLAQNPLESEKVDRSVRAQNRYVLRDVLHAYPWSELGTMVDVGGGDGTFLAGLLARHTGLTGTLVDLPHVVANAPAVLDKAGVTDRCTILPGSFFDPLPADADAYILKTILHDWNDTAARAVLRRVRAAMRPDGRLILLEAQLPDGDQFHIGKLLDLHSLVLVAGPDRSREDLATLLSQAGLLLSGSITTQTLTIFEATRD
ncbi:methyltransferase [Kribbella sp. NPDC004138]